MTFLLEVEVQMFQRGNGIIMRLTFTIYVGGSAQHQ